MVFPGQGSQSVGMGKALYQDFASARRVFDEVDDVLNQKLADLMFEGDLETLTLTHNAQPALMAVSMAVARVLHQDFGVGPQAFAVAAGHSLGEYSALCATGAFSLADTARLLRIRGLAMQKAVPVGAGAMIAVLGLSTLDAEVVARGAAAPGEICVLANDNAPGQAVLSGHKAAIDRAIELAAVKGAKRSILLPVSAPFHCPLMQPAAEAMAQALGEVSMSPPQIPIISNVTASLAVDPGILMENLIQQVTGRVRWQETVQHMAKMGVTTIVELGAGKVLSGLNKRILEGVETLSLGTAQEIETFANTMTRI